MRVSLQSISSLEAPIEIVDVHLMRDLSGTVQFVIRDAEGTEMACTLPLNVTSAPFTIGQMRHVEQNLYEVRRYALPVGGAIEQGVLALLQAWCENVTDDDDKRTHMSSINNRPNQLDQEDLPLYRMHKVIRKLSSSSRQEVRDDGDDVPQELDPLYVRTTVRP